MTDKLLSGYLNRLRGNLDSLDESIEDVRKVPKGERPADKRARLKLLRDLVELQNSTLIAAKTHLLGRDETGAAKEPPDFYGGNDQVEFERYFKNQLSPWTEDDLKLKCDDCGIKSEGVSNHAFTHPYPQETEFLDLCPKCYEKRTTESSEESESVDDVDIEPTSKRDVNTILQTARLLIKSLEGLPVDQRIAKLEEFLANKFEVAPGMGAAYEAYRDLLRKELDHAKAARDHTAQT